MDLTQLTYFRVTAQRGSMSAAARELHVTQPTLSVAIQKLEASLETTLFEREHRGVRLTSSGKVLLGAVGEVFAVLDEVRAEIHGLETEDIGRFVLGCPEALGAYFLPSVLRRLLEVAPRIELTLWNGPSRAVQRALTERDAHFGLVVNPLPHPDLVIRPLFGDATDLFVHRADRPETIESAIAHLATRPFIFVGHLPQARGVIEALKERDCLPARRLECGDLEMVKSLTLGRVGVGVLPRRVAEYGRPSPSDLVRLHLDLPFYPDQIALVYRADQHRTRAFRRVRDVLVEAGEAMSA